MRAFFVIFLSAKLLERVDHLPQSESAAFGINGNTPYNGDFVLKEQALKIVVQQEMSANEMESVGGGFYFLVQGIMSGLKK